MFREKVTIQDAIVAVSLVESSMQGSALTGGIDALHTSFPYNPMEEYRVQGEPDHQGIVITIILVLVICGMGI